MQRLLSILAVIAATLMAVGTVLAGEVLVIIDSSGTGDDFGPGKMIDISDSISLPEGARLSLLNQQGRMILVKGPLDGVLSRLVAPSPDLSGDGPGVISKIAGFMQGDNTTASFGASRGLGEREVPDLIPHPALISVMASGQKCIVSSDPQLWRADAVAASRLTLTGPDGKARRLDWPAGVDRINLPADLVADKVAVLVDRDGMSFTLTLNLPPAGVRNRSRLFAWLSASNCQDQAVSLLNALREEARAVQ